MRTEQPKVLNNTGERDNKNFFDADDTLHKMIEEKFEGDFLNYVKHHLEQFGSRCANEIDERAA